MWMTNNFLDEAGNSGASAPPVTVSASIVRYLRNKDRFVSLAGLHYKLNTSVTESLPQPLTDESFINQISRNRIAKPFYCVKQWLMPFKLMETIRSFSKIALPCPCSKEQKLVGSAGAQASCVHGPGRTWSSLAASRRWPVTLHALMCLYNGVQHHLLRWNTIYYLSLDKKGTNYSSTVNFSTGTQPQSQCQSHFHIAYIFKVHFLFHNYYLFPFFSLLPDVKRKLLSGITVLG